MAHLARVFVALALLAPQSAIGAAGDLDVTFGIEGKVTTFAGPDTGSILAALALQPDGRIVAAGWTYAPGSGVVLARYEVDGSLDLTFGTGGIVVTPTAGSVTWRPPGVP